MPPASRKRPAMSQDIRDEYPLPGSFPQDPDAHTGSRPASTTTYSQDMPQSISDYLWRKVSSVLPYSVQRVLGIDTTIVTAVTVVSSCGARKRMFIDVTPPPKRPLMPGAFSATPLRGIFTPTPNRAPATPSFPANASIHTPTPAFISAPAADVWPATDDVTQWRVLPSQSDFVEETLATMGDDFMCDMDIDEDIPAWVPLKSQAQQLAERKAREQQAQEHARRQAAQEEARQQAAAQEKARQQAVAKKEAHRLAAVEKAQEQAERLAAAQEKARVLAQMREARKKSSSEESVEMPAAEDVSSQQAVQQFGAYNTTAQNLSAIHAKVRKLASYHGITTPNLSPPKPAQESPLEQPSSTDLFFQRAALGTTQYHSGHSIFNLDRDAQHSATQDISAEDTDAEDTAAEDDWSFSGVETGTPDVHAALQPLQSLQSPASPGSPTPSVAIKRLSNSVHGAIVNYYGDVKTEGAKKVKDNRETRQPTETAHQLTCSSYIPSGDFENIFVRKEQDDLPAIKVGEPTTEFSPSPSSRRLLSLDNTAKLPVDQMISEPYSRAPFNRRLDPTHLSPQGGGKHTQRRFVHTPAKDTYKNSTAEQMQKAEVAEAARIASAKYKADHDAHAARNLDISIEESDSNKPSSGPESGADSGYANDLSTLADAPTPLPKKSVGWKEENSGQAFYRDSRVIEMQDSFIDVMNSPAPTESQTEQIFEDSDNDNAPVVGVYNGVPKETFQDGDSIDDSLEEFQISGDLGSEIVDQFQSHTLLEQSPVPSPVCEPILPIVEPELEFVLEPEPEPVEELASAPAVPTPSIHLAPLIAPLTDHDSAILSEAINACQHGRVPMDIGPLGLATRDLSTVLPKFFNGASNSWLNDAIIDMYLQMLVNHQRAGEGFKPNKRDTKAPAPSVHSFSPMWFKTIQSNANSIAGWAKAVNMTHGRILNSKMIFLPLCDMSHWRLIVIKPQERTIEYFDSLGARGPTYIRAAHTFLRVVLENRYVASEWTDVHEQRSSRQVNGKDCGVFTVLNALVQLRGEEPNRIISDDGMEDARLRITVSLLAGKLTGEMD